MEEDEHTRMHRGAGRPVLGVEIVPVGPRPPTIARNAVARVYARGQAAGATELAKASASQLVLTNRAEAHIQVEKMLRQAGVGMQESLQNARRSQDMLGGLEERISKLRSMLGVQDLATVLEGDGDMVAYENTGNAATGSGGLQTSRRPKEEEHASAAIDKELDMLCDARGAVTKTCASCGRVILASQLLEHESVCATLPGTVSSAEWTDTLSVGRPRATTMSSSMSSGSVFDDASTPAGPRAISPARSRASTDIGSMMSEMHDEASSDEDDGDARHDDGIHRYRKGRLKDTQADPQLADIVQGRHRGVFAAMHANAAEGRDLVDCPSCQRRYTQNRFARHYQSCLARQAVAVVVALTSPEAAHPMPPHPPTNVRLLSTTATTISLAWTAPVFDGGAMITEYQVQYAGMLPADESRTCKEFALQDQPLASTLARGSPLSGADVSQASHVSGMPSLAESSLGSHDPFASASQMWAQPRARLESEGGASEYGDGGAAATDGGSVRIAPRGITLVNLRADTDYVDIRVRAVNRAGCSGWSASIAKARTRMPVAPSRPRNVMIRELAATSFSLGWEAPRNNGGRNLVAYEVRLQYQNRHAPWGSPAAVRTLRVPASALTCTFDDLLDDTVFENIAVAAINEAMLSSAKSEPSLTVRTLQLPPIDRLRKEIARLKEQVAMDDRALNDSDARGGVAARRLQAQAAKDDVEVMYSVSIQRMRRHHYIRVLEHHLQELEKKQAAGQQIDDVHYPLDTGDGTNAPKSRRASAVTSHVSRTTSWAGDASTQLPESTVSEDGQMTAEEAVHARAAAIRRRQFHARLGKLNERLQTVQQDTDALSLHKLRLLQLLEDAVRRRRIVAAEYEVARVFNGDSLESTVIHGRKQVFPIHELEDMLLAEMNQLASSIATLRNIVLDTIAELQRAEAAAEKVREEIAERQQASNKFERDEQRRTRLRHVVAGIAKDFVRRCFEAWKTFRTDMRSSRRAFIRIMLQWSRPQLAAAFNTWSAAMRHARMVEKARKVAAIPLGKEKPGLGSVVLTEAERLRYSLADDTTATMAWLHTVERDLSAMKFSLVDRADVAPKPQEAEHLPGPAFPVTLALSQTLVASATPPRLPTAAESGSLRLLDMARNDAEAPVDVVVRSSTWAAAQRAPAPDPLRHHLESLLEQSEALVNQKLYKPAFASLRRAELVFGYMKDAAGLLCVYRLLSRMLEELGQVDMAAVHWLRCVDMARELEQDVARAEAQEALARLRLHSHDVEGAVAALLDAAEVYHVRQDRPALARVHGNLEGPLRALGRNVEADEYARRAKLNTGRFERHINEGKSALEQLRRALITVGLGAPRALMLEACSPVVPLLRRQLELVQAEYDEHFFLQTELRGIRDHHTGQLRSMMAELQEADACTDKMFVVSSIEGSAPRQFKTAAARIELETNVQNIQTELAAVAERLVQVDVRVSNARLALDDLHHHLDAELGELASKSYRERGVRSCCTNLTNFRVNDVLGAATGGLPYVAMGLDYCVMLNSAFDGRATHAFAWPRPDGVAGRKIRASDNPVCHTGALTCMAMTGKTLYTGSTDGTLCVWDTTQTWRWDGKSADASPFEWEASPDDDRGRRTRATTCVRGHDASILCVAAAAGFVVTGGADTYAVVWVDAGATPARRLRGHELSVTAVAADEVGFATGSADRTVRTWVVEMLDGTVQAVKAKWRLEGHAGTVTAIAMVGFEIVSGAASGEIIVWNDANGTALRKHQVHAEGQTVFALQFDAIKVVSYGADDKLAVTDLLSGFSYQETPAPHKGARIMSMQFDTEKLLTLGHDRSMMVWGWRSEQFKGKPPDLMPRPKEHVVMRGELLGSIAKRYNLTTRQLMDWNGLKSVHALHSGMRLNLYPGHEDDRGEENAGEAPGDDVVLPRRWAASTPVPGGHGRSTLTTAAPVLAARRTLAPPRSLASMVARKTDLKVLALASRRDVQAPVVQTPTRQARARTRSNVSQEPRLRYSVSLASDDKPEHVPSVAPETPEGPPARRTMSRRVGDLIPAMRRLAQVHRNDDEHFS